MAASANMVLFNQIMRDVLRERERQEDLRASGKFVATCATTGADQMTEFECFTVLGEEVGEVAKVLLDASITDINRLDESTVLFLRDELIQVAAVSVAWVERLDVTEGEP